MINKYGVGFASSIEVKETDLDCHILGLHSPHLLNRLSLSNSVIPMGLRIRLVVSMSNAAKVCLIVLIHTILLLNLSKKRTNEF